MFCTKCGAQIQEGANYCSRCGTPVAATEVSAGEAAQCTSGMATASLVCGIAGFFLGPLLSVLAIIFSIIALPHFGNNPALKGKGMAIAGLVLGMIGLAWIVFVIWTILVFLGFLVI